MRPVRCAALPDPGGAAKIAGKRAGAHRALQGHHRYPAEPAHRGRTDLRAHRRGGAHPAGFRPQRHPGAAGTDPCTGGRLRSAGPRREPGLQQAVRDGLPPARNMVCRHGQDVPVEHLTECPRRLQPVPYAGHHDHRRAGRGDRRPPQPAERHRAVRPCRL